MWVWFRARTTGAGLGVTRGLPREGPAEWAGVEVYRMQAETSCTVYWRGHCSLYALPQEPCNESPTPPQLQLYKSPAVHSSVSEGINCLNA